MIRRSGLRGVVWYESPLLSKLGVPHAFSTRLGGVSEGPFASMNLGNPQGPMTDLPQRIAENYARLFSAIGIENHSHCHVHQVHGCGVEVVESGQPFENGRPADAIVSTDRDRAVAVRVADCVPVLLATEDGQAVAAVHAGWRGVVAGVVPAAVERLRQVRPNRAILAAIGPCIGFDAFEVGQEVLEAFTKAFDASVVRISNAPGKGQVDLRGAVRLQLRACGIADDAIDISDRCTFTHADEFFSHRRENGLTGRMAAIIVAGGGS